MFVPVIWSRIYRLVVYPPGAELFSRIRIQIRPIVCTYRILSFKDKVPVQDNHRTYNIFHVCMNASFVSCFLIRIRFPRSFTTYKSFLPRIDNINMEIIYTVYAGTILIYVAIL